MSYGSQLYEEIKEAVDFFRFLKSTPLIRQIRKIINNTDKDCKKIPKDNIFKEVYSDQKKEMAVVQILNAINQSTEKNTNDPKISSLIQSLNGEKIKIGGFSSPNFHEYEKGSVAKSTLKQTISLSKNSTLPSLKEKFIQTLSNVANSIGTFLKILSKKNEISDKQNKSNDPRVG
ncbi:hypothetical protein Lgra_3145 [Legionella gratiana]|uniref:Uncharacterized protein n=1 Tax=Legionella gratiana TaxID=45066 RepID=A0A378JCX0_9GAMM|nr:hypothetical protein [Legionella gratiana]KTD06368.1 hypothetical protein Lgra_3145 [Legionella gratiana]STX45186.1 Uncharacterised protein [Legionella gratiana]